MMQTRTRRLVAASVWLIAFAFSIATYRVLNDHFDRLSRARQIARYGELPFRDFFDPGYFGSEFVSAGLQLLLGDNLLGELLLDTTFIATGVTLVLLLAWRISGPLLVGLAMALVTLLSFPRAYDFDKVLFYPLGVALCWRYITDPSTRNACLLGVVIAAGALFRYDTGIYVGLTALVGMAVLHFREPRMLGFRVAVCAATVALTALPALVFIQWHGGLINAFDQIATYAIRERERTQISSVPPIAWGGLILSGTWTFEQAGSFLYYLLNALPFAAAVALLARWRLRATPRELVARVASLTALCLTLNVLVLRDPIQARLGGIAGPAAILFAWVGSVAWNVRPQPVRALFRVAVVAVAVMAVWSVSLSTEWRQRIRPEMTRLQHVQGIVRNLSASPPVVPELADPALPGMIQYVRECTSQDERVLATWFNPELYVLARRGFAAGMVVLFGQHWSEPRFQARSVDALAAQSVPIVLVRSGDDSIADTYPILAQHLDSSYRVAGETDFGHAGSPVRYIVLVRKDRQPARLHPSTSLPCF